MRKIDKGQEPHVLTHFRTHNPGTRYEELSHVERVAIRKACTADQLYLCAYCCGEISGEQVDTMNEHILCRDHHPRLSLEYSNIVASCKTPGQCDAAKGNQPIILSPLMAECEEELRFLISGRVEGLTPRAIEAVRVLNLGDHETRNKKLVEKRRQLSMALFTTNGLDAYSPLEDDDLLQLLIDELQQTNNGKLDPFSPVVINILRSWLAP